MWTMSDVVLPVSELRSLQQLRITVQQAPDDDTQTDTSDLSSDIPFPSHIGIRSASMGHPHCTHALLQHHQAIYELCQRSSMRAFQHAAKAVASTCSRPTVYRPTTCVADINSTCRQNGT
eukprot:352454-Chlamydomonas_euryale.AAC.9